MFTFNKNRKNVYLIWLLPELNVHNKQSWKRTRRFNRQKRGLIMKNKKKAKKRRKLQVSKYFKTGGGRGEGEFNIENSISSEIFNVTKMITVTFPQEKLFPVFSLPVIFFPFFPGSSAIVTLPDKKYNLTSSHVIRSSVYAFSLRCCDRIEIEFGYCFQWWKRRHVDRRMVGVGGEVCVVVHEGWSEGEEERERSEHEAKRTGKLIYYSSRRRHTVREWERRAPSRKKTSSSSSSCSKENIKWSQKILQSKFVYIRKRPHHVLLLWWCFDIHNRKLNKARTRKLLPPPKTQLVIRFEHLLNWFFSFFSFFFAKLIFHCERREK